MNITLMSHINSLFQQFHHYFDVDHNFKPICKGSYWHNYGARLYVKIRIYYMLNQDTTSQSFEGKELILSEIIPNDSSKLNNSYLSKIKSLDVEQLKIYLGIAYFVLVSLLSLSLFF